jgi:hypothetical protein
VGGVTAPTYALTFGNLPQTNDNTGSSITSTQLKTVSFTLPVGQNYTLDNVILRLQNYEIGDVPVVQIRNDVGSADPGTTVLAVLANPSPQGTGIFSYTFTPSSSFTFQAATQYWLYVTTSAGVYNWMASSPGITPTGFANFGAYRISSNSGSSFNASSTLNSFEINATPVSAAVPFEFNPLIGMFGFFGSSFLLRKIKTRKITTKTIPS